MQRVKRARQNLLRQSHFHSIRLDALPPNLVQCAQVMRNHRIHTTGIAHQTEKLAAANQHLSRAALIKLSFLECLSPTVSAPLGDRPIEVMRALQRKEPLEMAKKKKAAKKAAAKSTKKKAAGKKAAKKSPKKKAKAAKKSTKKKVTKKGATPAPMPTL